MSESDVYLDPERLVDEYFLRDFTEREIAELNAALAMNPALRTGFTQSANNDLDLYQAIQHKHEEESLRQRNVVYFPRKSARTIRFNRINKIAASFVVLLCAGGLVYHLMKQTSPVISDVPVVVQEMRMVAEITDLFTGDGNQITAENSDETRLLHIGDPVGVGDVFTVPVGGRIAIKYLSDATTVSFNEKSSFKIMDLDGAKHLELFEGRMVADVAKQPSGKPLRILTDDAELLVLGTRFEVLNRKETVLSVLSGKVQMNDLSTNQSVFVSSGFYAKSEKGTLTKPIALEQSTLKATYSKTMPYRPQSQNNEVNRCIVVDSERNLTGRVDFNIPTIKGRISEATLRFRVIAFNRDRGGNGTVRVKNTELKDVPIMGMHSGGVAAGMDIVFNLDPAQLSEGKNSLLLEMDAGGDDFWLGSEDSNYPPELCLHIVSD